MISHSQKWGQETPAIYQICGINQKKIRWKKTKIPVSLAVSVFALPVEVAECSSWELEDLLALCPPTPESSVALFSLPYDERYLPALSSGSSEDVFVLLLVSSEKGWRLIQYFPYGQGFFALYAILSECEWLVQKALHRVLCNQNLERSQNPLQ